MNAYIDYDFDLAYQPGDVLWCWKDGFRVFKHYALVVRPDKVLENVPGIGERVVWLDEFLDGREVFIARREGWNPEREACFQAILRKPQMYHPARRNCETTVNEVIDGRRVSPQVQAALGLAALVAFGILIVRGSKV